VRGRLRSGKFAGPCGVQGSISELADKIRRLRRICPRHGRRFPNSRNLTDDEFSSALNQKIIRPEMVWRGRHFAGQDANLQLAAGCDRGRSPVLNPQHVSHLPPGGCQILRMCSFCRPTDGPSRKLYPVEPFRANLLQICKRSRISEPAGPRCGGPQPAALRGAPVRWQLKEAATRQTSPTSRTAVTAPRKRQICRLFTLLRPRQQKC
jgi:hypothetical protein